MNTLVQQTPTESTQLQRLHSILSEQNSRLISTIHQLENIGHRIKNTDFPQPTANKQAESPKPDGLLQEIELQLSYTEAHNNKLSEFLQKISTLL